MARSTVARPLDLDALDDVEGPPAPDDLAGRAAALAAPRPPARRLPRLPRNGAHTADLRASLRAARSEG